MIELIDRLRSVDRVFATEAADLIERLQAEVLEQCRINGMGAERELALLAKVERLERSHSELRKELQVMTKRNQRLWAQLESQSTNKNNPDDYVMQY